MAVAPEIVEYQAYYRKVRNLCYKMEKVVDLRHVYGEVKSDHKKLRSSITKLRKLANKAMDNYEKDLDTSQSSYDGAIDKLKEIEILVQREITMLKKHCIRLETEPLRWFNIAMALYNFIMLVLMLVNQIFLFEYTYNNIDSDYFRALVGLRRALVVIILGVLALIDLYNSWSRFKWGYRYYPAYLHPIRKHLFYGFTSASLAFIVLSDPLLIALYQGYASTTNVSYFGQLQPQGMFLFTTIVACVMCLDLVLGPIRMFCAWRLSQYMINNGEIHKKIDKLGLYDGPHSQRRKIK